MTTAASSTRSATLAADREPADREPVTDRSDTTARADLADRADIAELLRDFYGRAFRDELLGPIFVDVARMDLEAHLPVMCDFWQTVLFRSGSYRGNALHPHQRLHESAPLTPMHFDRWLTLWRATVDDRHLGPKAELAKLQASRIAGSMSRRITGEIPATAVTERAESTHRTHRSQNQRGRAVTEEPLARPPGVR